MPAVATATAPLNPFSTRFVRPGRTAYRFPGGQDAERVATDLIEGLLHRGAAAIIGPHGTGKSTLLHTLMPRLNDLFSQVERIQLSSAADARSALRPWYERRPRSGGANSAAGCCLVIDGFEQLGWVTRQRLIWQAVQWQKTARRDARPRPPHACLLLTAHRAQLGVGTVYRTGWDDEIVKTLTEEKLRCLPSPERLMMLRAADQQALRWTPRALRHRNVRDYWFALYDEYERLRDASQPARHPIAGPGPRNV